VPDGRSQQITRCQSNGSQLPDFSPQPESDIMKRILTPLLLGIIFVVAGSAAADSITFYENDNFGGREFTADRPVADFARNGFSNRVQSAVVHEGRWQICLDANFNLCAILAPGAYANLGAYAGRIGSVRPMDGQYSNDRLDDRGRNRDARATLYEGPNLSGRTYTVNNMLQNLGNTGFNDRASSLRVESGYWIFCSDAEFRGECRTFGPGDYTSLPSLNNVISSGRRISNAYPYDEKPDWQRDSFHQSLNFRSYQ
jgi:hypothetical protein